MNGMQTRQVGVLWNSGMSMAEISDRMGISIWQIARVLPGVPEIMLEAACHVAAVERHSGAHRHECTATAALAGQLTVGSISRDG